jgi:dihydrofolate synthase / folylpolyglutamate synthase
MDYKNVLKELYSLDNPKWTLGLERIEALLKKLGNPEKRLRCIHVAGTNGKGAVCAMISSILSDAGYKTGLYTSPHLKEFNERIRVNNNMITDKELVKYYLRVKKYITDQSFFEITTAMAFLYFYDKKVDFAVLEVGLGGRLDATNVITPLVSVITSIGLEHTNFLGNTIEKIATEKSGIIKENVPVITACGGKALAAIKTISNIKNSELIIINKNKIKYHNLINKDFNNKKPNEKIKNEISVKCKNLNEQKNNEKNIKNKMIGKNYYCSFDFEIYKNLILDNLMGKFQIGNAAIAVKAVEILKWNYNIKIDEKNIKDGLKNVKWPGRLQLIGKNVMVDCAHNPNAFRVLTKELKSISYKNLILVIGFSNDKDIKTVSRLIMPFVYKTIITKSKSERAAEPETIKRYFNKNSLIIENPKKGLIYAKKIASKEDLILITGSIFLVGEFI